MPAAKASEEDAFAIASTWVRVRSVTSTGTTSPEADGSMGKSAEMGKET